MKKFCILEQGNSINDAITLKHKEMFTTDFSDFYRLNWQKDGDLNAYVTYKNVVWSEGRSLIYDAVPKDYEYYIFIDDDIDFEVNEDISIAEKLKELLDEYNPILATLFDPSNDWGLTRMKITEHEFLSKKAFPMSGGDPQVRIFSQSFANIMFPVIYHGAQRSTWYMDWIAYKLFPSKYMCFTEIRVTNTRHLPQITRKKYQFSRPQELMMLFNLNVKDKSYTYDIVDIVNRNKELFTEEVNKEFTEFTIDDLKKIYDVDNVDFQKRKPMTDSDYRWRLFQRRLIVQPIYLLRKFFKSL